MAESLRSKVEEHLTCSVCLKQLKDPKVLPCLHSYCHGCIVNLAKNAKANTFNCPNCRLAVKSDDHTISNLPSNFFVNNLLATMALTSDKPGAKKIPCGNCDSQDASQSRCKECGIFLCHYCSEFHRRSRLTKLHELLTMEELKSSVGPQNIAERTRCSKHTDEVIKLFCKTCQVTICRDCTMVDHHGHKYGFIEEVAVDEKQHLQSNLSEVKDRKVRVLKGIENLNTFFDRLEAKKESTVSQINHHFNVLVNAAETRRREMVERANSLANSKRKQICGQLEELELALASCESSIEFTEQTLKNGNDVQILSMEKHILQSLEQLKSVEDQTEPCVTEEMMFFIPPSVEIIKEMLLTKYDVYAPEASPQNSKASFDQAESYLKTGKQYSITVICNDKNNLQLACGDHDIKPTLTGAEVSNAFITDNKNGSYTIKFCPCQIGTLKLEVSINGIPAPNCSLTKEVKWVMGDAHGKGVVTDRGLTMTGEGREGDYCWRVGTCYFQSGVHSWKIRLSCQGGHGDQRSYNYAYGNSYNAAYPSFEVGIIDYDKINENPVQHKKKWVYSDFYQAPSDEISFTLDMEKRTLNVTINSKYGIPTCVGNYQFTAQRVAPFFACYTRRMSISLVE